MRTRCLIFALALAHCACGGGADPGGSITGPSQVAGVPQVAGTWHGRLQLDQQGNPFAADSQMQLEQQDRTVRGTWSTTTPGWNWRGEVNGTVSGTGTDAQFQGTVTFLAPAMTGQTCTGQAPMSGTMSGSSMRWTSVEFRYSNCVNDIRGVVWTLNR